MVFGLMETILTRPQNKQQYSDPLEKHPNMCEAVKTKAYLTRKSPPYHAKDCKGQTRKGNDKKQYISLPDRKGVFKWLPKRPTKSYKILDNGGFSFAVEVDATTAKVYKLDYIDSLQEFVFDKELLSFSYKTIFVGDNALGDKQYAPKGMWKGNSLLFETKGGTYVYVGSEIFQFQTKDKETIVSYLSPVGNSAVPYPYAIGTTHTYFMLEKVWMPNSALNLKKDGYSQLYATPSASRTPFKTTVLQKRI